MDDSLPPLDIIAMCIVTKEGVRMKYYSYEYLAVYVLLRYIWHHAFPSNEDGITAPLNRPRGVDTLCSGSWPLLVGPVAHCLGGIGYCVNQMRSLEVTNQRLSIVDARCRIHKQSSEIMLSKQRGPAARLPLNLP